MKKILVGFLMLFLLINQQVNSQELSNQSGIQKAEIAKNILDNKSFTTRKYILGPNDIIDINLFGIPELEQKNVRIQPDGYILINPIGSIKVAGLTINELYDLLEEKYSKYIKNPNFSLKLVQSRPFIVYISGAVLNPGSYELNTITNQAAYTTRLDAFVERKTPILSNIIVAAGGITYDADFEHVLVTNEYENVSYEINLLKLIEDGDSNQDLYLMAGDSVHIKKLPSPLSIDESKYKKIIGSSIFQKTVPIKVYGFVNEPGLVNLDSAQSLNINSAITAAGGYLKDSAYAPQKVYLSRLTETGTLVTRAINPRVNDTLLMPNDVVYIPEKPRPLVGKTFDYATRVINPFFMFATTYRNWDAMFAGR